MLLINNVRSCVLLATPVLFYSTFMVLSTRLDSASIPHETSDSNPRDTSESHTPGWKSIDVFFGVRDNITVDSSQANQTEAVLSILNFKRNGYFVDLAANEAFLFSNSFYLEEMFGWSGLCIEANPLYWNSLSQRRCKVVAAAVGNLTMEEVRFRIDNEVYGGLVGESFDNKMPRKRRPRFAREKIAKMFTVSLHAIFLKFNVPDVIDYMSLDVEGAEELILSDFPFNKYRFTILTIERPSDKLKNILFQNGYKFVRQITSWGETFWINLEVEVELNMTYFDDHFLTNFSKYYI